MRQVGLHRNKLGQDLYAALVVGRNMHVHVPEKRVVSDARASLPAQHPLGGSGALFEAGPWATAEVASLNVECFVAPTASCLGDWQWKGKPLKQEHTEECTRVLWARGTKQGQRCAPSATSSERGTRRDGQTTMRSS